MIKKIRSEQLHGTNSSKIGVWAANNFSMINNSVPTLLNTVNMAHKVGVWGVLGGGGLGCQQQQQQQAGCVGSNQFGLTNNSVPTLLNTVNMAHKMREGDHQAHLHC